MKVILKEDVKGLGVKGSVCTVKNGYAVNFLLPQGKAEVAVPSKLHEIQVRISKQKMQKKREKSAANKLFSQLNNASVVYMASNTRGSKLKNPIKNSEIVASAKTRVNNKDTKFADVYLEGRYTVKDVGKAIIQFEVKTKSRTSFEPRLVGEFVFDVRKQ